MAHWTVYILRCSDGSLYTGITKDLERRVGKHNAGKASKYTRSRRPVRLAWRSGPLAESAARRREARIKTWDKARKESLVRSGPERRRLRPGYFA